MKKTVEGRSICNFNIAIDDTYSKDDRADFVRIVAFGNQAENCMKYLRKGFLTGVTGRLRSSTYTDADGVKRYPVDVTAERVQFLQWPERKEKSEPVETTVVAAVTTSTETVATTATEERCAL
jgi:single-strand DNA-binding protein